MSGPETRPFESHEPDFTPKEDLDDQDLSDLTSSRPGGHRPFHDRQELPQVPARRGVFDVPEDLE